MVELRATVGRRYVMPRLLQSRVARIYTRPLDWHTNVSGTVNANWVALCRGELCANFAEVSYRRESTSGKLISLMPTRTVVSGLNGGREISYVARYGSVNVYSLRLFIR